MNEPRVYNDDDIDLLAFFRTITTHKGLIIIITIIITLIGGIIGYWYNQKHTVNSTTVSFTYAKIERGLNPDGTAFNKQEILPLVVLQKVYNKNNIKENFSTFKSNFEILPIIPDGIKNKIESAKKNDKDFNFTPIAYEINTKYNKTILGEVVNDSIENFNTKYFIVHNNNNNNNNNNNMDYSDKYYIMSKTWDKLNETITQNLSDQIAITNFGKEINKIKYEMNVLKDIDIRNFYSLYNVNNLSLYPQSFIINNKNKTILLSNEIERLQGNLVALEKILKEYKIANKNYLVDKNMKIDNISSEDMKYYNSLITKYINTQNEIGDKTSELKMLKEKIANNNYELPNEKQKEKLDAAYNTIMKKFDIISNQINDLDYKVSKIRYSNLMAQSSPILRKSNGKPFYMFFGGSFILGICLGVFFAFLSEFKKEYKLKYGR